MTAVLQRVKSATVYADGKLSGSINEGLYILLGVERHDTELDATLLSEKISKLRIFSDENGKMNLSLIDIGGGALVVSNFTLAANYKKGNRPDYLLAEEPNRANFLYRYFIENLKTRISCVQSGVFGADMQTDMQTDGPVTIIMKSDVLKGQ